MNKHILKYLLALVPMAFTTACAVDEYNNEHLDGFNPDEEIVDVQTLKHTLTDEEYAQIANNRINKQLAEKNNLSEELKRVGSDKMFSEKITAKEYLPAFLQEDFAYHLSNGSSIIITYNSLRTEYPETVIGVSGAKEYKLASDDYAAAWADEGVSAAYFTPGKPAESYIPAILKTTQTEAKEGDYVIASYKFSEQEPSNGGEGGETPSAYTPISKLSAGQTASVKATVLATNNCGLVIADGATEKDRIYIFLGAPSTYSVGDVITVDGTVGERGGLQFEKPELAYVEKDSKFTAPAATAISAEEFQNYPTAPSVKYVELTGKYTFSGGKYHNFEVEGSSLKGSFPYANLAVLNESVAGKTLKIKGYIYSYSKNKDGKPSYINIMATELLSVDGVAAEKMNTVTEVMKAADGTNVKMMGQITATTPSTYVINDCTGYIYVQPANFDATLKVGDLVEVEGSVDAYHKVNKISKANVTKKNTAEFKFNTPAPRVMVGTDLDAYLEDYACVYASYTGKLVINGRHYNILVDGAVTAQGSLRDVDTQVVTEALNNKDVVVSGYLVGIAGDKFINTIVTDIKEASASTKAVFATRAAVTTTVVAAYKFNGTTWDAARDVIMVNHEDYVQMGASHDNFSDSFKADTYLPTFLANKYPYAQPDFTITVGYYYYANKETSLSADEYTFNGSEWVKTGKKVENSAPFNKKDGKWLYDPSLVIELGTMEAEDLADEYFVICINDIKKNKPAYAEEYNGKVETERYSGCSIYKHNLDWRLGKTITAWEKAGEDISAFAKYKDGTSEEKAAAHAAFYEKIERQFAELMVKAVNQKHSDVKMIDGIETIYTFNIKIFIGKTVKSSTHAFRFKLVKDGQFEYMDMKPLSDEFDFANPANFQM